MSIMPFPSRLAPSLHHLRQGLHRFVTTLAVAGAASDNMNALVFGLILSVALMALASTLVAALLARYRWIGWLGLAIIVYVAIGLLADGVEDLMAMDYKALLPV